MSDDLSTPEFSYKEIPPLFKRCFQSDCPLSDTCIRFLAGRHIGPEQWYGYVIFPTARQSSSCRAYKQTRIMRAAWGFNTLFSEVKKKHDTPLRREMKEYLGGNTMYYRFHHGERILTPEQQQWILNLFRRNGYDSGLAFDHYCNVYDFTD